jgi:GNAT superfamily N-acetyltransferase
MIEIRPMRPADLQLGLRLTRQAGWNQTESDWLRFMDLQPQGCFVGELDEVPVGTTTTCIFGDVAWVAMVLVDVNARRKGVATALLNHALDFLEKQEVKTIRLDATAAGQPVYEKLGFTPEYRLARYEGIALQTGPQPHVTPAATSLFAEIVAFDHRMTGTHRGKLLTRLFEESPHAVHVLCQDGQLEGFVTLRRGVSAIQIGPCIATAHAGTALLSDALGRCAGQLVFIDIPCDNAHAVRVAERNGLTVQRCFTRMYRGPPTAEVEHCAEALWASSGPEKG